MSRARNRFAWSTVATRLPEVLSADGHTRGRKVAVEVAEDYSLRNLYAARAKLMHRAMIRFVTLCYETHEDSHLLANVDPATRRLLVSVPWGWTHYQRYGLHRGEADALRWEMIGRQLPELDHTPLVVSRRPFWFLRLADYPTLASGYEYLKEYPITWQTLYGFAHRM